MKINENHLNHIISNSIRKIVSEGDRTRRGFKDSTLKHSTGKGDRLTSILNSFVKETSRLISIQFQDLTQKYAKEGVNIEPQAYQWEREVRKTLTSNNFINLSQGIIK